MRVPLIVGVRHDCAQHLLLDAYCQKQFQKRILPLITPETLLLIEGSYRPVFSQRGDWSYWWRKWEAEGHVGTHIGSPTIGWRDARFLKCGVMEKVYELAEYADKRIAPRVTFSTYAHGTRAALCDAFVSGRLEYHLKAEHCDLDYCREIQKLFGHFDWPIIASAHAWAKSNRHAIILCGALHAFTIHRYTEWPVEFLLADNTENIRDSTRGLICKVLYPEAVLGRMS
jgi:hypothetical protein